MATLLAILLFVLSSLLSLSLLVKESRIQLWNLLFIGFKLLLLSFFILILLFWLLLEHDLILFMNFILFR